MRSKVFTWWECLMKEFTNYTIYLRSKRRRSFNWNWSKIKTRKSKNYKRRSLNWYWSKIKIRKSKRRRSLNWYWSKIKIRKSKRRRSLNWYWSKIKTRKFKNCKRRRLLHWNWRSEIKARKSKNYSELSKKLFDFHLVNFVIKMYTKFNINIFNINK